MKPYQKTFGHVEISENGKTKVQHAVRYNPKTFYKLNALCEKENVSVNSKVNEIIEKYLRVK